MAVAETMPHSGLAEVPIGWVRANPVSLRDVDEAGKDYKEILDSIIEVGQILPIAVQLRVDPETNEEFLEIIDGLHRWTALKEAGATTIEVSVKLMKEQVDVLVAQHIANAQRVATKPGEFSQQLRRIMHHKPGLSINELAAKICRSPDFIKNRLSLTKIVDPDILKLIDDGQISLQKAYALAKLPAEEQGAWVSRATSEENDAFVAAAKQRAKEIKDEKRKGQSDSDSWTPAAHLRKAKEIKEALENPAILEPVVAGAANALEGALAMAKWSLHLDDASVQEQKEKYDQRKAEQARAREAASEKKLVKAETRAKKAQFEADLIRNVYAGKITQADADAARKQFDAEAKAEAEAAKTEAAVPA
jgi:ParB/RepB/Spo0J family partition protein